MKPVKPSKPVLCPACAGRRSVCTTCNGEGAVTAERALEIEKSRAGRKPVKEA